MPLFIDLLQIGYPFFTEKGVLWLHGVLRATGRCKIGGAKGTERGIVSMTLEIHEQTLWLIPVGFAVSFLVWVLWHWWREGHHPNDAGAYSSGATVQYRSSGRAQVRQSDSPFTKENRPKLMPSPQR